MKGAKSTRTHNERSRKGSKRSEKSAKLDRKSSRGMIYENEELRLRTININAEVERGQSDIKRLRRENEHLRREIWSLRDECDRLNKRFKAKLSEHEYGGCRGSGGSGRRCSGGGRGSAGCDGNSDDSESCDTCRCDDDGHCSDECCQERGGSCVPIKQPLPPEEPKVQPADSNTSAKPDGQPMHFDHLSVVSEETLSNPEMLQAQLPPEHLMICTPDLNSSQSTLPSLVGPLTPLTPIELVANQLNDLQAMVPPLSYFENILAHHQSPNTVLTPTPELGTSSSTTTGQTMKHTNGWDYNLQSPFSQRKYSNTSSPSRSPPPAPLTTFVPTSTLQATPKIALNVPTTSGAGGNIETVAITTNATQQALNSPKHFFAPIKPRLRLNTELANRGQDALPPGSPPPPHQQPEVAPPPRDPPDIFVNNALATPYQRPGPRLSPQTDSVNLESLLNDIQTISGDILAIQLEKSKSRDNLMGNGNDKEKSKPYRSEMNLYLQYDGTNPTISNATSSTMTTTVAASDSNGSQKLSSRTRSLEREHTDSPAPHMPDPMAPFPEKCTYLGFEQINQAAQMPPSPSGQKPPLAVKPSLPAKPPPPLPPARRPPPVSMPTEPPPPPPVSGVAPNKSHLYKSLANAAAKRAIFRSAPTQLTRSLDVECAGDEPAEPAGPAGTANEEEDAAKRKARRVSIVCGEEQPLANGGLETTAGPAPTTTASCGDLTSATSGALIHPAIKAFRQISHSTPSSPHSLRRCINSNTMTAGQAEAAATASAPPSTTHHHHHRKESSDPAPMTATVSRTKCSRRHSEGTVHSGQHRISGSSGGAAGGNGGHHHHHSHHHQHSSLISSNPHHSHHSHQDSNHETVTSQSDRNSNSFGSSRESSTSFSMRSNRRKISISSHTGGKIPWCGCWGNGCL
ncbi:proline-rich protein 36 isoform X6 [Drosophila navojoa]|uniref:proline-rich protein 36 isoform X6 n=1 Tax=Drosophila navojoa TaxID=7232 RepID=UPI0008471459|nr:proline-rich protein 36 isoform X6 [Drosophila navojoa]